MDNKRGIINYKKKYRKSLKQYLAMLQMADIFDLEQSSQELLFAILDEEPLEDWEWERILEQDRRLRAIFSEHPFYRFAGEYPAALRCAAGKMKIMSN